MKKLLCLAGLVLATQAFAAELIDLNKQSWREAKSNRYGLSAISTYQDTRGQVHVRFEQTFDGLPIVGYHVISKRAGVQVLGIENDIPEMALTENDRSDAALAHLKAHYANQHGLNLQQLVFDNEQARKVIYLNEDNRAIVAYEVNFFVDTLQGGMPARPYYYLSADDFAILDHYDGLATHQAIGTGPGGNQRVGFYRYGQDYPYLDITPRFGYCQMSNQYGQTVHMYNNQWGNYTYMYGCRNSYEQAFDSTNGAASPVNDAHFFMSVLYQFYIEQFNRQPLPFPLVMRTHYGRDFANAFWDGRQMTFGDGDARTYPFVILDIAAHEVAHGVTQNASNLAYQGQSGGINESFSDMASRALEAYLYGEHDWKLGGGIYKDLAVDAMRYMDTPSKDGKSIEHVSQYYQGIDVHHSSGIFNKAFYLIATAPGWNTMKAFEVMDHANHTKWSPRSDFQSAAFGVMLAAQDLGYETDTIKSAFAQVGIYL